MSKVIIWDNQRVGGVFPAYYLHNELKKIREGTRALCSKMGPHDAILAHIIRQWTSRVVQRSYGPYSWRGNDLVKSGEQAAVEFHKLFGYDPRVAPQVQP